MPYPPAPNHHPSNAGPPIVRPAPQPNLLDAMEDFSAPLSNQPAPPRPFPPEIAELRAKVYAKLTAGLHELAASHTAEMEQLTAIRHDLLQGEPAIIDEMARLEAVRDVCQNVRERYRAVVGAAEKRMDEVQNRGEIEVDEIICANTIVGNQ